ncbi:hypothetical protein SEPCBS57363_004314 [Sporothrix epigloea]|uniref:RRM domain-containing protein n=1 Tax=Sporothrix epigloea TaxID=1892477 RepID=A0ABP0DUA1_9PEZI
MAFSGPPGVNAPHPSLPARPPPSTGSAPSIYSAAPSQATNASSTPFSYYGAAAPTAAGQQQPKPGFSRTYAPVAGGYSNNAYNNNNNSYIQQPQTTGYGTQYTAQYGPATIPTAVASPAVTPVQNPFPISQGPQQPPSYQQGYSSGRGGGSGYLLNQNNSSNSYATGVAGAAGTAYGTAYGPSFGQSYGPNYGQAVTSSHVTDASIVDHAAATATQDATATDEADTKKRTHTVYRSGGGKTWTDDSLLEWDPNHPRLFVGNLAGEVTDDTLLKAFAKWRSVQKALVKRDKWTKKSRGYGFVSFSDADDFFQAAKEMNGKYIGSHPVVVRKSTTDIKAASFQDESGRGGHGGGDKYNNNRGKKYNSRKNGGAYAGSATHSGTSTPVEASGSGISGSKVAHARALGPVSSGVQKTKKKKNGLKLLG